MINLTRITTPTTDKKDNTKETSFYSRLQWASILVLFLSSVLSCSTCSSMLPEKLTLTIVADLFTVLANDLRSVSRAKSITPVISRPFFQEDSWEEPKSSFELFGNSTKLIWGYWDSYPDNLPDLCQKSILSWQLRNPDWKIIILNDQNYKQYVSVSDLPTTFDSLKVQHRSDILRLAVLIRYGGIYMDASTLVYKGFDDIWDAVDEDKVLLTSLNQLPKAGLDMYNNGLLMTKRPYNPFLLEWRRRIVQYSENPALSIDEMKVHPAFSRVNQHWNDPTLGILGAMIPYHSNLWILNDLIWHNESGLSDHVMHLPKMRWGFYFHVLPYFFDQLHRMSSEELKEDPSQIDPEFVQWTGLSMLGSAARHLLKGFTEDIDMANGVMENIHILKFTSHNMDLVDFSLTRVGANNTVGRVFSGAFEIDEFPTQQANLLGAAPPATIQQLSDDQTS